MPIVNAIPFSQKIENFKSCILNEFLFEEIKPLVIYLNNLIKIIFPNVGEISTDDFLCFFTQFSEENHSSYHVDESHVTVSICLENLECENEDYDNKDSNLINIENHKSKSKGEFIFYKNDREIVVDQKSNHALIFMGNITHRTNGMIKKSRYNLNFYFKQFSPENNITDFYNRIYIDYLTVMEIENKEKIPKNHDFQEKEKNYEFNIPQLSKFKNLSFLDNKEIRKPNKFTYRNDNLLKIILNYLDKKSMSQIELANKYFYNLSQEIYKSKYINETNKMISNNLLSEEEKNNLNEKINSLNFKRLDRSLENSRNIEDNKYNLHTIHLENMNIGEYYIKFIRDFHSVDDIYAQNPSEKLRYHFKETLKGIFEPKSIIVNSTEINHNDNMEENNHHLTNFNCENFFNRLNESCYVDFKNQNVLHDSELLFEKIRKEAEQSSIQMEFLITLSNNPALIDISNLLANFLEDNFSKSKKIIAPLFINKYESYSPLFLHDLIPKVNLVMQYEKEIIEDTARKQSALFKDNIFFKNYSNDIFTRALLPLILDNNLSDLIWFNQICLIQQSFSPVVFPLKNSGENFDKNVDGNFPSFFKKNANFDFSNGENTYNSIFVPYLHERLKEEKIKITIAHLYFFGNVLPRDIMAIVGSLKCNRKIEFLDWGTSGMKCFSEFKKEKIFKNFINSSCHCLLNTIESLYFYEKMKNIVYEENTKKLYSELNTISK